MLPLLPILSLLGALAADHQVDRSFITIEQPGWLLVARIEIASEAFLGLYFDYYDVSLEDDEWAEIEEIARMGPFGIGPKDRVIVVDDLWVAPTLRGRGVGRALIEQLEQYAAHRGIRRIAVFAAPTEGPDPIGFYRSLGFEILEKSGRYESALMMKVVS